MKKKLILPIDDNGNVLHCDRGHEKFVENYVFTDTLTITGFSKGRSSVLILLEGEDQKKYNMFLSTLIEVSNRIINGKITGVWTFCKKGSNYGVKLNDTD